MSIKVCESTVLEVAVAIKCLEMGRNGGKIPGAEGEGSSS